MWYTALLVVAALVALVAVFGLQPKGGRRVEGTQMMTGARIVVALVVGGLLIFALQQAGLGTVDVGR